MSADWRLLAACQHEDSALFFAADGERTRRARETRARAICAGCPVQDPCLDFRLSFPQQRDEAIWAGYDGEERRALRHAMLKRQQRRVA